jgi:hypothetical protein
VGGRSSSRARGSPRLRRFHPASGGSLSFRHPFQGRKPQFACSSDRKAVCCRRNRGSGWHVVAQHQRRSMLISLRPQRRDARGGLAMAAQAGERSGDSPHNPAATLRYIGPLRPAPAAARGAGRRFNHVVQRGRLLRTCRETDHRSGVLQDAARFRKTISLARSTKARKLAAMWRRPG